MTPFTMRLVRSILSYDSSITDEQVHEVMELVTDIQKKNTEEFHDKKITDNNIKKKEGK